MMFNLSKILVFILMMLLAACGSVQLGKPSYWLSPSALKEVFVGKTVSAKNLNTQQESLTFYYGDGTVLQKREGLWRTGIWRVKHGKQGGRICLSLESKPLKCRAVKFNTDIGAYQKYIPKKNGQHQAIILYQGFDTGNTLI